MALDLLERQGELRTLTALAARAATGHGATVLVSGEAGIGKTSLLRSFAETLPRGTRVLAAGCEDLLTPRALGPLRDAVRGYDGALAAALAGDPGPDAVYAAALDDLAAAPSVLVVDDAHWADGATLDVLRLLSRRMPDLPALLLVTYRDDEVVGSHPLRRVLGRMTGADVVRLRLDRLSAEAVGELAAGVDIDAEELHRLTLGNPFYVTEVLAAPEQEVPATVVDAVLGRVGQLSDDAQRAVQRLAVVPRGVELGLLRTLQPDLTPITEAEAAGVLTMRGDLVRFRHELARRTVDASLPASLCAELNANVLRALLSMPSPDPFRLLHHAVAAGDDDAVVTHGLVAGRTAARSGAYRQAASCFRLVLDRDPQLPAERRARLAEAYAWALSHSNELHAAAAAAQDAVTLWERAEGGGEFVRAVVTLSRQLWLTERTAEARVAAVRALDLARRQGRSTDHALALVNLGGLLVVVDDETAGLVHLDAARELADELGARDIGVLARNYTGSARLQLGDLGGLDDLHASIEMARADAHHEGVLRGYYNLAEGTWRLGRYDEALAFIAQGEEYARDRDFPVHAYMFEARRYRRLAMQGRWAEAVAGLRELVDGRGDPGMIGRETLPVLARLLVRQGHPDAPALLAECVRHAERADVLEWLVPTGVVVLEDAWLQGRPELAGHWPELLLARTDRPGCDVQRREVRRHLARLGHPAGARGDGSADGDPYEQALDLLESADPAVVQQAIGVLDGLAARPAADLARARLRDLGVRRVPRRPAGEVVENPAGLTARQVEILRLLAAGLSNGAIADRLVLSTRTVDHHVAAVLAKLGVHSRHEAAAEATRLGLA
ncbi:ATP-binding protein [Nocardioides conyzicola]|uniref:AAA family ATPase n=1 Tax=Nocardioides conyzicola TaxID=1651781 RepID=A0ABP8X4P1_9ACTN